MKRATYAVLLVAMAAIGGCRFWYKPVPVANAIGEERTLLAGDSVNVHREARFEIYGPSPEAVYDGYEQLNRTYREFERSFRIAPPKLAFVLEKDTVKRYDAATLKSFADRGYTLIRYVRPRSYKNPARYSGLGYGGVVWPIAPTAARMMLAAFAGANTIDSVQTTNVALERFPVWFRAAVIHLLGEAGGATTDLDYVREKRSSIIPLRDLFTLTRTPALDSLIDPTRRGDSDDVTRLIAAEASTIGRFLTEREGPAVLGQLARGYLAHRSFNDMLAELEHLPHNLVELDQRWRVWVETREEN
jgi:hypothetical protein